MATINYNYYSGVDKYNDGIIEQELYDYYQNKIKDLDLYREDTFYITSSIRENIINWYPFKKEGIALEIGAGMGPITGALCDKCKKVVSIEGSKRRAEVLYERHKNKKNLEIYAANVQDVKFQEKFDYVVLIGVFEYSKIFFNTTNPFEDFLNYLKTLIKPNGKILIAIENRYGMKYLAGVTEDHYGEPYLGLKGYEQYDIETLGKEEWKRLLKKCNIHNYKFYYPYPDYKMPSIIYTDNRLPFNTETAKLPLFHYTEEFYSYDYREILNGVIDNNMFGFFSNSFLIEIANENAKLSNVNFVKIQNNRSDLYKNMTILYDNNSIEKIPLTNSNIGLKELMLTHQKLNNLKVSNCKISKNEETYNVEFIEGILASEYVYQLYLKNEKEEIINFFEKFYTFLLDFSTYKIMKKPMSSKLMAVYEKENYILKYGLLDLNLSNIIIHNNEFVLFDQELATEEDIPTDYVMYFSIELIYSQIPRLENLIKKSDLLKKYKITKSKIKVLIKAANEHFEKMNYFDKKNQNYLVKHSNLNLISSQMDFLNKTLDEKIAIINDLNKQITELENSVEKLENSVVELKNYKKWYNQIVNSKGWKMLEKLKQIKQMGKK